MTTPLRMRLVTLRALCDRMAWSIAHHNCELILSREDDQLQAAAEQMLDETRERQPGFAARLEECLEKTE